MSLSWGQKMNDAEFEKQSQRIQTLWDRWILPVGLAAWKLNCVYVRNDFMMDGQPAPEALATASTKSEYMLATLSWNMPVVAEHDDRELERIFLHEVSHILVNEMRPSRNDTPLDKVLTGEDAWHEERVCTMIGNALLWTRESVEREFKAKYEGC